MTRPAPLAAAALAASLCLAAPARADAQWYFDGYLGGNHTRSADVSVDQPDTDVALDYRDVRFTAEPGTTPPYYGWRIGRFFGTDRRVGVEFEFVHLKVIADTGRVYDVVDRGRSLDLMAPGPMSDVVQRYSMTHGLNFLLVNAVVRQPFGAGRHALAFRIGAGPTLPHAESTVSGRSQEQYEVAGLGGHAAAGATIGVWRTLAALVEYKLTYARPEITIAGGTGRTSTLTHHLAAGFSLGLGR